MAWRPSCSCDTDATSKLLLALRMEVSQNIGPEENMFEHCYINSAVSLNPWCARTEIKYKEEQEEKLACIFFTR